MTVRFECTTVVAAPVEVVFDLSLDIDQQVKGPFRTFHHEHLYEHVAGETVMIDRIRFDAPVGIIGRVVERAVLGRYLQKLIEQRGRYIKAEAEKRHG